MAWLDDHPPARDQFRCPRREKPSGVCVIHTAENTPDFVAFDGGAEAVASFIRGRSTPGSYHDLCDSDSCINLVAYTCEAYQDGTGSNPHAWGGSVATRADTWPLAPKAWRDGAIRQLAGAAARYARWVKITHGITVPARRINRAQSEARMPGFISHAERDPGRRSDPGAAFPWAQFLDEYARAMGTKEDDAMTPEDREWIADQLRGELRRVLQFLTAGEGNTLTGGQPWTDEALTLPDLLAEFGRPGSKPRVAMQEMSRRGVNWSLGTEAANDDQGLLKARLDGLEAKLVEIGEAVSPSVPEVPDVPPSA